jgi:hypothetical protein
MWKRFLIDLSKAMLMTDPMAYGLYMAWSLEAPGGSQPDMAPRGRIAMSHLASGERGARAQLQSRAEVG